MVMHLQVARVSSVRVEEQCMVMPVVMVTARRWENSNSSATIAKM
jgi:hypothetical protein